MRIFFLSLFMFMYFFSFSNSKFIRGSRKLHNDSLVHTNNENYILHVMKATAPLKIDGLISEPDWAAAEKAENFHMVLPVDSGQPKSPSEVVMTLSLIHISEPTRLGMISYA